jgi:biotin transport system substrate-specific component
VLYALGPTGGYLAGFVAAACVIGWLAEHGWGRHPIRLGLALAAGTVVVYAFGAAWLATLLSLSIDRALGLGVLPFLPGDVFKAAMVAIALPSGQSLLERVRL